MIFIAAATGFLWIAMISASDDALPGTYKILLGTQSGDVTISKFLTVIIE